MQAVQHPHGVPTVDEFLDDLRADETKAPGDKDDSAHTESPDVVRPPSRRISAPRIDTSAAS